MSIFITPKGSHLRTADYGFQIFITLSAVIFFIPTSCTKKQNYSYAQTLQSNCIYATKSLYHTPFEFNSLISRHFGFVNVIKISIALIIPSI